MIRTEDDLLAGLGALCRLDPRLEAVVGIAGRVPLRRGEGGLPGLAATIVAQQVSRRSAEAILARLAAAVDLADAAAIRAAPDETFRLAGLSRPKQRTMRAVADAVLGGGLDFARLAAAGGREAVAELVAVHGVGPWTAGCYLLFHLGHPDVFPAGDLALQVAVGHALGLGERPKEKALALLAGGWTPHRSAAARLFWSYYHAITRRDAAPAPTAGAVP